MKKFIAILISSTMLFAPLAFAADENTPNAANANAQQQGTDANTQEGTQPSTHHKTMKKHKHHCECECKGKKHKTMHHKQKPASSSSEPSANENTQNTNTGNQ